MLPEAFHFVIAAVVLVSVPIVVWKFAEMLDRWRANRLRNPTDN